MRLDGLWRYPVKSLGGEALTTTHLAEGGVPGDRKVHVRGSHGPLTGRTRPGLLTLPASTGPNGTPQVCGLPWTSSSVAAIVRGRAGDDARLVAYGGPERFDVLDLLVATDGAVERFGHDIRRLRPNLLIAGVDPEAEATWPGRALVIGDAVIGIHSMRARCVVTSIDPDSGEQDLDVSRRIQKHFGGQLALNAWVIRPGVVQQGDRVELVDFDAQPAHIGGWIVGAPYVATAGG